MDPTSQSTVPPTPRPWKSAALVLGLYVVVGYLLMGPRPAFLDFELDVSGLPTVNASLNAAAALCLVLGFVAIRAGRIPLHRGLMIGAFSISVLFLLSYVTYHWFRAGPTAYEGGFRGLYLFVLITHIVCAPLIPPLALVVLGRGLRDERDKHRRLARPTLALWMYSSVTGVLIYGMLYL